MTGILNKLDDTEDALIWDRCEDDVQPSSVDDDTGEK